MGKKKKDIIDIEEAKEFISEFNPVVKRTPDTLTIDELMLLSSLIQDFLIKSKLLDNLKNSKFYQTGNFMEFYKELPVVILSNPEARESFNKIVEFILEETLDNINAKKMLQLYNEALHFIKELDIFGFFSRATTVLTSLIKG
jgi:hypothetical protein